jgi:hypothetical protein
MHHNINEFKLLNFSDLEVDRFKMLNLKELNELETLIDMHTK